VSCLRRIPYHHVEKVPTVLHHGDEQMGNEETGSTRIKMRCNFPKHSVLDIHESLRAYMEVRRGLLSLAHTWLVSHCEEARTCDTIRGFRIKTTEKGKKKMGNGRRERTTRMGRCQI